MPDPVPPVPVRLDELLRRYGGATQAALSAVLCPLLVPIHSLDKRVFKVPGQGHYRASFQVRVNGTNDGVLRRGRTGKFVPPIYATGAGVWIELAKGRIIELDTATGLASGEVYVGGSKAELEAALARLDENCFLEIDQYGAAAKVLSALTEFFLTEVARASGYSICRMPEDMARHLGSYSNYDFEFCKNGASRKVEAKSLWGTNTNYARLIHSTTSPPKGDSNHWTPEQRRNYYPTSSCKFDTQDIFAVNLFLRTGNIRDFAFARSVPIDVAPYGLPRSSGFPEHVHQNPRCTVGDGTWFGTIDEVWNLP